MPLSRFEQGLNCFIKTVATEEHMCYIKYNLEKIKINAKKDVKSN